MTTSAKALMLVAPGQLERRSLPLPRLGSGDALLRVEACGLCGTDHEQYTGVLPIAEPFIPGHEIVGTNEEITPEAHATRGLTVGDRVGVEVFQTCAACDP